MPHRSVRRPDRGLRQPPVPSLVDIGSTNRALVRLAVQGGVAALFADPAPDQGSLPSQLARHAGDVALVALEQRLQVLAGGGGVRNPSALRPPVRVSSARNDRSAMVSVRCSSPISGLFSLITLASAITFSSSRTFPGHEWRKSATYASTVNGFGLSPRKYLTSPPTSSTRLRNGGSGSARVQGARRGRGAVPDPPGRRDTAAGGGDDPDIDLARAGAAEGHEPAILQKAQQLGLSGHRHVADFVQEQRSAVGLLEQTRLGVGRRRVGPFRITEQLAFDQVLGDRGAVDRQETSLTSAGPMD